MGTWLKRNTSKKYVLNQDERSMDQILEGLLDSGQPEGVKSAVINMICEKGALPSHPATTVRRVLEVACKWILHGTTSLQVSSGLKLLSSWGAPNPANAFPAFFTPDLVSRLVQGHVQGHGHLIAANVPLLLREGFRVLSRGGPSLYEAHAQAVQASVANMVRRSAHGDRLTVRNVGLLLWEFPECVPANDAKVLDLCVAILEHLSKGVPPTDAKLILKFVRLTDEIADFLSAVWSSRPQSVLEACLADIFRLISTLPAPEDGAMDRDQRPEEIPICLASVVRHIPIEMANRVVKEVVTDASIPEASVECAVSQIVEWLKWPSARNVDLWLSCFLTELAAHCKFSLLIRITELNTEQVVVNLMYPRLRPASFKILSQMLLSFQHSPAPFHKSLDKLVVILSELKKESSASEQARSWLRTLAGLMHCLMHQHSGFPELYDPVLDLIKDCPCPSTGEIMAKLQHNSWLSQVSGSVATEMTAPALSSAFTVNQKKLEEGKTGLDNLGNTCYMNSVLQALYMCDQFRRGILTKVPNGQETLLEKLQHVFALLCQSNRPSVSPTWLLQASRPPWFMPGQQQDCSEFLKYLLDRLHEDERGAPGAGSGHPGFMRSVSSSSSGGSGSPGGTLKKSERKAAVTLTAIKMKTEEEMSGGTDSAPPSLVECAFRGKVETTLRCLACKTESTRLESFSDIPLAFPNTSRLSSQLPQKNLAGGGMNQAGASVAQTAAVQNEKATISGSSTTASGIMNGSSGCSTGSCAPQPSAIDTTAVNGVNSESSSFTLNDLIAFYLKPERLTGDNKYHCDKCGKLQDGERSIAIAESPNYLILSLLRFSYDTKLQSRTKIFQDVQYPRTLAIPVSRKTASVKMNNGLGSRHGSSASLSKQYQHSRSSSSSSFILTNNNDDSKNLQDIAYQEKLNQLAQRLCPKIETCGMSQSTSQSPSSKDNDTQECELYGLSAVIIHSGTSSECGHYYCYARHSQSGQIDHAQLDKVNGSLEGVDLLPDKWYNFNDSRVSHASYDTFSNVTKRFSKDTAYVLIYCKLDLCPRMNINSLDPVLRPELRDSIIKDNEKFIKEQELEAQAKEEQRRRSSSVSSANFSHWTNKDNKDDDDDSGGYQGPGCGPGMGGGLDTSGSRFIF